MSVVRLIVVAFISAVSTLVVAAGCDILRASLSSPSTPAAIETPAARPAAQAPDAASQTTAPQTPRQNVASQTATS